MLKRGNGSVDLKPNAIKNGSFFEEIEMKEAIWRRKNKLFFFFFFAYLSCNGVFVEFLHWHGLRKGNEFGKLCL